MVPTFRNKPLWCPGTVTTITVALTLGMAACGSPPTPQSGSQPAPTATSAAPTSSPTAAHTPSDESESPHDAPAENVTVGPSSMLDKVAKLGIDMSKTLAEIPMGKKKKLMPLFQKALGHKDCTGCHAGEPGKVDFKTDTHSMKLARGMWDNFIVKLRDEQGSPIFCDSCHQGQNDLLNRKDKDALNKFMHEDYEQKFNRADNEEHSCSTCHTDVFEGHIFRDVWGIKDAH